MVKFLLFFLFIILIFYPIYRFVKKLLSCISDIEDIDDKKAEFNKIKARKNNLTKQTEKEISKFQTFAKEYNEILKENKER